MVCKQCGAVFSLVHTQYWELKDFMGIKIRIYVYQCTKGHFFASALELHPPAKVRRKELRHPEVKIEKLTPDEINVRSKMKPLDIDKDFFTKQGSYKNC